MKYPIIIFYRHLKYDYIDKFLKEYNDNFNCTFFITGESEQLKNLYNSKYHLLITYGESENEYNKIKETLTSHILKYRWLHLKRIIDIDEFNDIVNKKYINFVIENRILTRPIFSIFTTCYNSYEKILRCYQSVLKQSFYDWEWVIVDDSPDEKHFTYLNEKLKDNRIRKYKRSENSGSIGNVKNEATSLCRGRYILELDHDDEIIENLLLDSVNIFENDSNIGFIYSDFTNIMENGDNFSYGGMLCKGYGGYYMQKIEDKWVYVYVTPNINNITLSSLICCPNHARIWRKEILDKIENYSEYLYICDDYELILKTILNTKVAKLHKLGYIQYMNNNENNFSLIRNSEINRIGPNYIMKLFYEKYDINKLMKENDAYEDEKYIDNHSFIWKRDETYINKYSNKIINNDYNKQICIIGIETLISNIGYIKKNYEDSKVDIILLDNILDDNKIKDFLELINLQRMKFISLSEGKSKEEMMKCFHFLYRHNDTYEIIVNKNEYEKRVDIINNSIKKEYTKYLEIGIEYGFTFSNVNCIEKIGVDPDPKMINEVKYNEKLINKTSFDFFKDLSNTFTSKISCSYASSVDFTERSSSARTTSMEDLGFSMPLRGSSAPPSVVQGCDLRSLTEKPSDANNNNKDFDIIFIDGMHQIEYVIDDINNSINFLNKDGIILIDDIIPLTYGEQLKVPENHYYENNILKYKESWTGDVWKIIFYILNYYEKNIKYNYFVNSNYRGVLLFSIVNKFQILKDDIEKINNYDYYKDYETYICKLYHYADDRQLVENNNNIEAKASFVDFTGSEGANLEFPLERTKSAEDEKKKWRDIIRRFH